MTTKDGLVTGVSHFSDYAEWLSAVKSSGLSMTSLHIETENLTTFYFVGDPETTHSGVWMTSDPDSIERAGVGVLRKK